MTYTEEVANYLYMESIMEQQNSLKSFINECVILAEGSNVISKLKAFNEEEENKGTNAFLAILQKAGEFISRLWNKFIHNVQRFVNNQKWLEKNKDIILNKDGKYPVKFKENRKLLNYFDGIARVKSSQLPRFDYANIKDQLTSDENAFRWMAKEIGLSYEATDTSAFSTALKNYFLGAKTKDEFEGKYEGTEYTNDQLTAKMKDIYDYCHDYDKIKDELQKYKDIWDVSLKAATDIVNEKINEAVAYSMVYGRVLTEADEPTGNNTNTGGGDANTQAQQPAADANKPPENPNGSANNNTTANRDVNSTKNQNAADTGEAINKAKDNNELVVLKEHINRYKDVAMKVMSAALEAAEKTYKEFMKLITDHLVEHNAYHAKMSSKDQAHIDEAKNKLLADLKGKAKNVDEAKKLVKDNLDKYTAGMNNDMKTSFETQCNTGTFLASLVSGNTTGGGDAAQQPASTENK